MRKTLLMSAAMFGLSIGAPAFAQTPAPVPAPQGSMPSTMPPGTMSPGGTAPAPVTAPAMPMHRARPSMRPSSAAGAMPGHEPGMGNSEPGSTQASNIDRVDTRGDIAPRLPAPNVGPNATPEQLLSAASQAIRARRTGAAQEALERAETRALDRSTQQGMEGQPSASPMVQAIGQARRSLATRDFAGAQQAISMAMNSPRPAPGMGQGAMGQGAMGQGAMGQGGMSQGGMMQQGMPQQGMAQPGMQPGTGMQQQGMAPGMSQPMGQQMPQNSAYSPPGPPGSNALATYGATNGNAIGATTGGPSNANGIPGTPNGASSNTGSNSGGGGGGGGNGGTGK